MKKILTTLALSAAAAVAAAPAQAATVDLTFNTPTLESGTAFQTGAIYRYSNVSTGVDMLLTLGATSTAGNIYAVDGNQEFYQSGSNDNFELGLDRTNSAEADTFVNLVFQFVNAGTTDAYVMNDATLTFGDIDSHFDGPTFSDYVQFDASQFSFVNVGSELTEVTYGSETRYVGSYEQTNYAYNSPDQLKVSVSVGLDGISSFNLTWGYEGAGDYRTRILLMDGSNELADINPVPEPASAALLGLGGLALLARRRR